MDGDAARRTRNRRTATVVVFLVTVGFLAAASYNFWRYSTSEEIREEKREVIPVSVLPVRKAALQRRLRTTGDLRPISDVYLYPAVPGKKVEEILVDRGSKVHKGQIVVRLDDAEISARIRQAKAAVEAARIRLHLLEKDRRRFENLYREKALARRKLDRVRSEWKVARAQWLQARSALKALQARHEDFVLRSPVDGLVADRFVDPGNLTDVKKPILRITEEETVKVVFHVPERDFPYVKEGTPARCRVDAFPGRFFPGRVAVVTPILDPVTRTATAEIHTANPRLELRSGMFAHVEVELGERSGLVIPKDAVIRLPGTGSPYVFVVEGTTARMKNVRLGMEQGIWVEVREGLQEGQQVVVRGQNRLSDGISVRIMND